MLNKMSVVRVPTWSWDQLGVSSRSCDLFVDCIQILTDVHTDTPVSNPLYSYRHTVSNSTAKCTASACDMCTYEPLPKLPGSVIMGDQDVVALNLSVTAALVPAYEGLSMVYTRILNGVPV